MATFDSFDDIISFFRLILDTFGIDVSETSLCLKALSICSILTLVLHVIKVGEKASSPNVTVSKIHPPSRKRKRESSVGKKTKVRRKTLETSSSSSVVSVERTYPKRTVVTEFEKVVGEEQQDSIEDFNRVVGEDQQDSVVEEDCEEGASGLLNTGFCADEEQEQEIEDVNEIIENDLNN